MVTATALARAAQNRRIGLGKPQVRPVERARKRAGPCFGHPYRRKRRTGRLAAPEIVRAKREILGPSL